MKRLTLLVLGGLLGVVSTGLGYDGPSPTTYDQTINGVRVVLTTQGAIRPDGNARFTMTAYVPIAEAGAGSSVELEIRKANPTGPESDVIASCAYVPPAEDVGRIIAIPCSVFHHVAYAQWEAVSMLIYPRIVRQQPSSTALVHDGRAHAAVVSVAWDDRFEDNDVFDTSDLPDSAKVTALPTTPLVHYEDLVSDDLDYYQFTVPPDMGVTQVHIEFWNAASDLDLFAFDPLGALLRVSESILDEETVTFTVEPGLTYYFAVRNYSGRPAFYDLWVTHSPPDAVTMLWGPFGTPNPVAPGFAVSLAALATAWPNEVPTYSWTVSCPTLESNGSLDDPTSNHPIWTAPPNNTWVQQICTISVTASHGTRSVSGSYRQVVDPAADYLVFVSGPRGVPDPVESGGTAALSTHVADSLSHALTYSWTADCGALGPDYWFSPSPFVQDPMFRVPDNMGPTPRGCVISVEASDAFGHTIADSYYLTVMNRADVVALSFGEIAPNPVAAGGLVRMTAIGRDAFGHALTYTWGARCASLSDSGAFPSGNLGETVTWRAPQNLSAEPQVCTLTVTASDGVGGSATQSYAQRVEPLPHVLRITAGPAGTPEPVASGGSVALQLSAEDSLTHTLAFAWTATCAGLAGSGQFLPGPNVQTPTWVAPDNLAGNEHACTLEVRVNDGRGTSTSGLYVHRVQPAQIIAITEGPTGEPNPVFSGGTVRVRVAATSALGRTLSYAWTASCSGLPSAGAFADPSLPSTTWAAPSNLTTDAKPCSLMVTIRDGVGALLSASVVVNVASAPYIVGTPLVPGTDPNALTPGAGVSLNVVGMSGAGPLTYGWSASCPGLPDYGVFDSPTSPVTRWTAPPNPDSSPRTCTLSVRMTDSVGQVQVASFVVTVTGSLESCVTVLDATQLRIPNGGGSASVHVTAADTCSWTSSSGTSWVRVASGSSGRGNGTVVVDAGAFDGPEARLGSVTIGALTVQVVQDGRGYIYYLAEGATIGGFFETRLAMLNMDRTSAADVEIDFQIKDTSRVLTHRMVVGPHQRATADVGSLATLNPALGELASSEFSTVVRSSRPLVVDRTMTWDSGKYGAHSETAVTSPASTWYLAEGATLGNFELYYLIQNPNDAPLNGEIEITYMLPAPQRPIVRTYSMGPHTRRNIPVHLEPGLEDAEVSAVIRTPSGKPVIVERAMYLSSPDLLFSAGNASAGIREPRTSWFFSEGATGEFFDLFVLIGNPNDAPAHVTATYLFSDGTTCSAGMGTALDGASAAIAARSRYNLWVDREVIPGCARDLSHESMSITIRSDLPVIAERSMWWPGPTADTWAESHNSSGATEAGTTWAMADAEEGGASHIETYVLIANTSTYDGAARVTLFFEDGSSIEKTVELLKDSRTTVPVGVDPDLERRLAGLPERSGLGFGAVVAGQRFGVLVESLPVAGQAGPAQIVVERSTYWDGPDGSFWAAGVNALATKIQ